ncbi:MAG: O-antigen translocase [Firmicutes bacterium]|nr:O-antigen translocase [Bacillota bacterium]
MTKEEKNATGQIFKATAIMGGASAVSIVTGVVKNKVIAVLLGPECIGLMGLLQAVLNTAETLAGMGLATSGIRQIADAQSQGNASEVAQTRHALRRASFALGLLGALFLIIFREPVATLVLGDKSYAGAIAWMAVGAWATVIAGAQTAILNGLRRLGDLARAYIFSALGGMLFTVLAVWQWGEKGVIAAVISTPLVLMVVSWWFMVKLPSTSAHLSWTDLRQPLRKLFNLGFTFMITSLTKVATQLAVRIMITQTLGIAAAGYFQAAWSISLLYLGFILEAMGKDYYPRLTAVNKDRETTNNLVNEQIRAILLLAGPVILGTLTLTAQVVQIIYSGAFSNTVVILQWLCIGDLFKIASWPVTFILVAQGRGSLFFATEFFWHLVFLGLVWGGLPIWQIKAAGIAYLLTFFIYFWALWLIAYRVNRFAWRKKNLLLLAVLLGCALAIAWGKSLPGVWPLALGLTLTAIMGAFSMASIARSLGRLPWNKNTRGT